jgi:hypothetical protein
MRRLLVMEGPSRPIATTAVRAIADGRPATDTPRSTDGPSPGASERARRAGAGHGLSAAPPKLEALRARLEALAASLEESLRAERGQTAPPVSLDAPIGGLSRMGAIHSQQIALWLRERRHRG